MKTNIIFSTVTTLLLMGVSGLHAEVIKGEAAAKAKVEESISKEAYKAKQDMSKFNKEALEDVKKVDASEKVKELEAKDKAEATTKTKAFKKEAEADKKQVL